jgi:hypothetical protein
MKRLVLAVCAAAVTLLPLRAGAQHVHPADSPRVTFTVTDTLVVGTAVLKAGDYKFQCRTFDGKTFLVVTSIDTGKEITRIACVREDLSDKVTDSELRSSVGAGGVRELRSVRIKGETVAHKLVP